MSHRHGDAGPAVDRIIELLQSTGHLTGDPPSSFDERVELAVRSFQQQHNLTVDGVVGPATFQRLDEARWHLGDRILNYRPGAELAGDDVYALQQRLLELGFRVGPVDGYFGAGTEAALREFQRNVGVPVDGTCGPATLKALGRLAPLVRGGAPNALRAEERIRRDGPSLTGKVVALHPLPVDLLPRTYATTGAEILHDVAERIEGRLVALGVQAFLSRPRGSDHQDDGADFANRVAAHLALGLGVEASDHPDAGGVACYFFGSDNHQTWSSTGERLAGLVQREIVARTDLADLRHHAKAWEFLRRTRMPAVQVDLGYLSNQHDADRLADPGFRDVLAEAIVVAIQRFYLTPDLDSKTGVLRLSELRSLLGSEE